MEENNSWMDEPFSYLFRVIAIKLKNKADKNISEFGLNSQQGHVIDYINSHEGCIQKDLSNFFKRRDASTTSILQGLEKKGYIERRILKENEREKRLYVLLKGKELISTFSEKIQELENEVTKCLSEDEIQTLLRLLIKINHSI